MNVFSTLMNNLIYLFTITETTVQPSKEADAVDAFTFSTVSDLDMTNLGVAPLSVSAIPTSSAPQTYSIIFDNLDFYMQTHHQSTSRINKSIHWIHHVCHQQSHLTTPWQVETGKFFNQLWSREFTSWTKHTSQNASGICCFGEPDNLFGIIQDPR